MLIYFQKNLDEICISWAHVEQKINRTNESKNKIKISVI